MRYREVKIAITVTRALVGITGAIQLVLGVLFWAGHAMGLVQLHTMLGLAFVLALMTLAVLSARAGAPAGLVATALAWGLLIPALGMTQMQILPGPAHWVVRVAHLLTGLAGMGLAGALSVPAGAAANAGRRHRRGSSALAPAPSHEA